MLSLAVNRRTALLFLGSGAGAVLMSACGGNTSNTESSASPLASFVRGRRRDGRGHGALPVVIRNSIKRFAQR